MSNSRELKRSASAQWSLIFGILSIAACWIFASVPAIILGCIGLGKTSGPDPEASGRSMAKAGILTGCIGTIIGLFSMGIWLVVLDSGESGSQQRVNDASTVAELAEIKTAIQIYSVNEGTYPESLEKLIPLYLPTWDSITLSDSRNSDARPYLYRRDGFRAEDPTTSPILLTPFPVEGSNYRVVYADGNDGITSDPKIVNLFD